MLRLACGAMAKLAVQRLISTQLILDPSTVTGSLVPDLEIIILVMHAVGRAELPVVDTLCALLGRVRIHRVTAGRHLRS